MNRYFLFACSLYVINFLTCIFNTRSVLDEFLQGSCKKQKYKAIKRNLSRKERITLSYIEQYIKIESEKKSFRSYYRFYLFEMVFVHIKFACVTVLMLASVCDDLLILIIYMLVDFIDLLFVSHEEIYPTHITIHRDPKRNRQRLERDRWPYKYKRDYRRR